MTPEGKTRITKYQTDFIIQLMEQKGVLLSTLIDVKNCLQSGKEINLNAIKDVIQNAES